MTLRDCRLFSLDPDKKKWTCPRCGEILPLQLQVGPFAGRYVRRMCECEHHAVKVGSSSRKVSVMDPYTWLGREWADTGLNGKTFATFQRHRQPKAYAHAETFAARPVGVLLLFGSYGTGKTHLLAAICNALRTAGTSCLFTTAPKLFSALQVYMKSDDGSQRYIARAIHTPLLVLDDIDKAKPSEYREEVYFEIIDERTKAGRPLAISMNTTEDLPRHIGNAACSRLMTGLIAVHMTGEDYRLKMV